MSSLEMFGLFFRYSCSCSYLSVKKVLSCSFWLSDRFSSPPSRFNSLAMLLSSSGVMLFLFLYLSLMGNQGQGGINSLIHPTPALSTCQLSMTLPSSSEDLESQPKTVQPGC